MVRSIVSGATPPSVMALFVDGFPMAYVIVHHKCLFKHNCQVPAEITKVYVKILLISISEAVDMSQPLQWAG